MKTLILMNFPLKAEYESFDNHFGELTQRDDVIFIRNPEDLDAVRKELKLHQGQFDRVIFATHGNHGDNHPIMRLAEPNWVKVDDVVALINEDNAEFVKQIHLSSCRIGTAFEAIRNQETSNPYYQNLQKHLKNHQKLFLLGDTLTGDIIESWGLSLKGIVTDPNYTIGERFLDSPEALQAVSKDELGNLQSFSHVLYVDKNIDFSSESFRKFLEEDIRDSQDFSVDKGKKAKERLNALGDEELNELLGQYFYREASKNEDAGKVEEFYRVSADKKDFNPNFHNWGKTTLYIMAAERGYPTIMEDLEKTVGFDPNHRNKDNTTAFLLAAKGGNIETVSHLFSLENFDPRVRDKFELTGLMYAAQHGHIEVVKYILANDKDVDVNLQSNEDSTAATLAARNGHAHCVEAIAKCEGFDPNLQDKDGWPVYLHAALEGNIEMVNNMFSLESFNPKIRDHNDRTGFLIAVQHNHTNVIEAIIAQEKDLDPNVQSLYGQTAATLATRNQNIDHVRKISQLKNFDPNLQDKAGWPIYLHAAYEDSIDIIDYMFSLKNFNPQIKDYSSKTALMIAAQSGNIKVVEYILANDENLDINAKSHSGSSAAIEAARHGHADCVKAIAKHKDFDPNVQDTDGWTVYLHAAHEGNIEMLNNMFSLANFNPKIRDHYERTDLMLAIQASHTGIVEAILANDKGLDINAKSNTGDSAVFYAVRNRDINCVKIITQHKGFDPNIQNHDGWTALMLAANHNNVGLVKLLIEEGADIFNSKNNKGKTGLSFIEKMQESKSVIDFWNETNAKKQLEKAQTEFMTAAQTGDIEAINSILANNKDLDINAKGNNGYTAAISAARYGHADCVEAISKHEGFDPNAQDNDGWTVYLHAAREGNIKMVNNMFSLDNFDPKALDNNYRTGFMIAAQQGHTAVVEAIMEKDKDLNPNAQSLSGQTAAIYAARNGHTDCFKTIAKHDDFDPNSHEKDGWTALMFAADNNNVDLVKFLIEKGANINMANDKGKSGLSFIQNMKESESIIDFLDETYGKDNKAENMTARHIDSEIDKYEEMAKTVAPWKGLRGSPQITNKDSESNDSSFKDYNKIVQDYPSNEATEPHELPGLPFTNYPSVSDIDLADVNDSHLNTKQKSIDSAASNSLHPIDITDVTSNDYPSNETTKASELPFPNYPEIERELRSNAAQELTTSPKAIDIAAIGISTSTKLRIK